MGHAHTPADDIFYDLVSIQYHALKGAQVYEQYLRDAEGHQDVQQFLIPGTDFLKEGGAAFVGVISAPVSFENSVQAAD